NVVATISEVGWSNSCPEWVPKFLKTLMYLKRTSPFRSWIRWPHSARYSSISRSSAFHKCRSWRAFSTITSWAPTGRILSYRPLPVRVGSPSIPYSGWGWTTARADQGLPFTVGDEAITCSDWPDSGQKGQKESGEELSSGSSPQMSQERVMGSLHNSIASTLRLGMGGKQSAFGIQHSASPHLARSSWYLVRARVTWAFVPRNPLRGDLDANCQLPTASRWLLPPR